MMENQKAERYVIYIRKSEDDKNKQVRSIEDQLAECREIAQKNDLFVSDEIVESRSAKRSGNRPLFTGLLKKIEAGKVDGIIAWAPDRLARNMKEAGEIIDFLDEGDLVDLKFASMYFVNDYNGKMNLGISFVLAKQYTDKLSIDVSRGINKGLIEGKSGGQYKPGYLRMEKVGYYQPDEIVGSNGMTTFGLVRKAWEMRLEEELLKNITDFLNLNGYKRVLKKNARKFHIMSPQKLSSMFSDPFYYGILKQGGKEIVLPEVTDFTPMVTEDEFLRVQRLTHSDLKNTPKKHFYPLKGIVICGVCKSDLAVGAPKGSGGKYLRYWCQNKACAQNYKGMRAKDILAKIVEVLDALKVDQGSDYKKYVEASKNALKRNYDTLIKEQGSLARRQRSLESEYSELTLALKSPKSSLDKRDRKVFETRKNSVSSTLLKVEERIEKIDSELKSLKPMDVEKFLNHLKTLSTSFMAGPASLKDEIAKDIFLNLQIKDGKVVTGTTKEPFKTMLESTRFKHGGPSSVDLEPLMFFILKYPKACQTLSKIALVIDKNSNSQNSTHYNREVVY